MTLGSIGGALGAVFLASAQSADSDPGTDARSIGWWLLCAGALLWIFNQGREAFRKEKPTQIKQPIQIEHVAQFLSVDYFNTKLGEIDGRFEGIETQIRDQVQKTDTYMHEMRHEVRGELQAVRSAIDEAKQIAQGSTSKAHGRVDAIAASVAEARGEIKQMSGNILLLLQRLGGKS